MKIAAVLVGRAPGPTAEVVGREGNIRRLIEIALPH